MPPTRRVLATVPAMTLAGLFLNCAAATASTPQPLPVLLTGLAGLPSSSPVPLPTVLPILPSATPAPTATSRPAPATTTRSTHATLPITAPALHRTVRASSVGAATTTTALSASTLRLAAAPALPAMAPAVAPVRAAPPTLVTPALTPSPGALAVAAGNGSDAPLVPATVAGLLIALVGGAHAMSRRSR